MPLSVVMYVYMEEYRSESLMVSLAAELMQHFKLSEENFPAGGPLFYLPREDYDLAHVEGKPGFLLDVNLSNLYYGVGYERGDLRLFVQIAEWLEQKLPDCRVFYGEDCSGEGFPFDESVRNKLMNYHDKVGFGFYLRDDMSEAQKQELRALHSERVSVTE